MEGEGLPQAPVLEDDRPRSTEERPQIGGAVEPVHEAIRDPRNATAQGLRRAIPQAPEDLNDVGAEEIDAAVGEERRDQSGDLLIPGVAKRDDRAQGILRDGAVPMRGASHRLEDRTHLLDA
jgi:hypothetical protein